MSETFGQRLRATRMRKGLQQRELAEGLMSTAYLSLLESDKRPATDRVVSQLAVRLGVSESFLRHGVEEGERLAWSARLLRAEAALVTSDFQTALSECEGLADHFDAVDDMLSLAQACRWTGLALEGLGRYAEAIREFKRASAAADKVPDIALRVEIAIGLSRCYGESGDRAVALDVVDSVLKWFSHELRGSLSYARLIAHRIGLLYFRGDFQASLAAADEAISMFDDQWTPEARASVLWSASIAAEAVGDNQRAVLCAQEAVSLMQQQGSNRSVGTLRVMTAWLYLRSSPPNLAEARHQLELARAILGGTFVMDLAQLETETARLHWLEGDFHAALASAETAYELLDSGPDTVQRAHALMMAARANASLGQVETARSQIQQAQFILQLCPPSRSNALEWRQLGDALSGLGLNDDAMAAYQFALTDAGLPASSGQPQTKSRRAKKRD